ncbi:zinc-dependent metalloprotease [Cellulomonas sp. NPDC055163]
MAPRRAAHPDRVDAEAGVTGAGARALVDWDVAARLAGRLATPGPRATRDEAAALVEGLRSAAAAAPEHVARITGLTPADGRAPATVHVVDRPAWARVNTRLMSSMTRDVPVPRPVPGAARLAAATQVGAVLALLSGKVLGQFDPFTADVQAPGGRLLLVAPNVLQAERAMRLDPADFRLWVCLHEQTHALQFAAAPWLADHLRARSGTLLAGLSGDAGRAHGRGDGAPDDDGPTLLDLLQGVAGALGGPDDGRGILDLLPADQRALVDEVGAVMALLEGHADVAMDAVGRSVVPSVRRIRARFEARRDAGARSRGPERVVRRLLGLDAKLAQYRDGAAFVRTVRAAVGTDGLNAVWAAPEHLPSAREIAEPGAWVRRVHG